MAKRTDQYDLTGLLRDSFRRSGLSIKALSDRAGVPYASVHAFAAKGCDVTLRTAGKLCRVLGLTLKPVKSRKGG